MGLNRSPDKHWCHRQEYGLEDLVNMLDTTLIHNVAIVMENKFEKFDENSFNSMEAMAMSVFQSP